MSYFSVILQKIDEDTETWSDFLHLIAYRVNKTHGGESFNAGADQYHPSLNFDFRFSEALEVVAYNTQLYRLIYKGRVYDIRDYDDYMERHRTVRLVGVCYG